MRPQIRALLVHLLTATGAVFAILAMLAAAGWPLPQDARPAGHQDHCCMSCADVKETYSGAFKDVSGLRWTYLLAVGIASTPRSGEEH